MRSFFIFAFFALFIIAMDLYAIRGIHRLFGMVPHGRGVINLVFWGTSLAMTAALVWAATRFQKMRDPSQLFSIMVVIGIFLMLYIPKLFFNGFQLTGDLTRLVIKIFNGPEIQARNWFLLPGSILGILLFAGFGFGMLFGRTHIRVFRETVTITGLPRPFDGIRIVQISDLHLGGFYNQPGHVRKIVERINSLEPDLILFTGDMVHNFFEELDPFTGILAELKAPLGKFAVLGNHDYGHYFHWNSEPERQANLERVKELIRTSGFDLLLNEHRTISLNGSSMEIIGVENWGKPPFPQEGDLAKAMAGTDPEVEKILLSHDPSHWDRQVKGKEHIALTLSGHTHGMQFGIEIGKFRWSPSKWTYKQWAGLYREKNQSLYVNRGLGYTGFPGRVGIRPEITLLSLEAPTTQEHSPTSQAP